MAHLHQKSPQSLPGASTHSTMVTQRSMSWSWIDNSHPLSYYINLPSHSRDQAISNFDHKNFKVKIMGVVKGHGHVVSPASNWFTSSLLHINQTNKSWDSTISKFDLEKSKVKVMGEVIGQGHVVHPVSIWCTSFSFHLDQTKHSRDMANIAFDLEKTQKFFIEFLQNLIR